MNCNDAAEFVSALCDHEAIPREAAEHIKTCVACQARLSDYIAMGAELRSAATLEPAAVPQREWSKPQTRLATWWQKGWETMRIPKLAFAALIVGILALASTLAVVKVRANGTGTVVLLNTVGPDGPLMDCPLSTQDKNQATCSWLGKTGSRFFAYKVTLLARDGNHLQLAIRTRTYPKMDNLSSSTFDADPTAVVREVRFEPGEPLKLDVPELGTLTLKGEWMDHMPVFMGMQKQDLSSGPGELRIVNPLLLKDKTVAGDLEGCMTSTGSSDRTAVLIYMPQQGSFLLSLLPMKGAVEAQVKLSRISFEEGGHSWEFVTGAPVSRGEHIWVLHTHDLKTNAVGQNNDTAFLSAMPLVEVAPGEWVPKVMPK
jgi:hypothetical protein